MRTHFSKPHLSIQEQVDLLIERGLQIPDRISAEKVLSNISYYRLIPYCRAFQTNGEGVHVFHEGITFDKLVLHYQFDRDLRLLVFDMIEQLEISFRTAISYYYSLEEDRESLALQATRVWWYEDASQFIRMDFHSGDLSKLDAEVARSREKGIKHHKSKYSSPSRLPSWKVFEVVTLGTMSKLYGNLTLSNAKRNIAEHFKLPHPTVLQSWMQSISYIRNICAHHSRLWNRILTVRPIMVRDAEEQWLRNIPGPDDRIKLYTILSCLLYLLKAVEKENSYVSRFNNLIDTYSEVELREMGFPLAWREEPLWRP